MTRSRIARLAAAGCLAVGLAGLAAPAVSAATSVPVSRGEGWLRLAHLSPNTPAVDVYLYAFDNPSAKIVLRHVAYGTVSPYEEVPGGEYTVAMRAAGASAKSKPVLSTTVDISAGDAYTVAGMGPFKGLRLQILHDALTTPRGKALVRVIQASLQQHTVTVRAGGQVLARHLRFGDFTGYRVVAPGTWRVSAAGASESASSVVSLAAGTVHTLVILDDPGRLTITDLTDAAGSKVLPAGAPQTGLGGTAPRPGAPLLPWVAVAAAGLAVTAGSAVRIRRNRQLRAARPH
jgi:Domain of unknown function (DUF4397)